MTRWNEVIIDKETKKVVFKYGRLDSELETELMNRDIDINDVRVIDFENVDVEYFFQVKLGDKLGKDFEVVR